MRLVAATTNDARLEGRGARASDGSLGRMAAVLLASFCVVSPARSGGTPLARFGEGPRGQFTSALSTIPTTPAALVVIVYGSNGSNGSTETMSTAFQAAADRSQQAIARCAAASACVAGELDRYADWIEGVAPQLPSELRVLPSIVRRAATGVRVARSRGEAVRAIRAAVVEVRKTIALVRADDPLVQEAGKREAALTADTLIVARNELEKATGL